jgi:hypothetical protein
VSYPSDKFLPIESEGWKGSMWNPVICKTETQVGSAWFTEAEPRLELKFLRSSSVLFWGHLPLLPFNLLVQVFMESLLCARSWRQWLSLSPSTHAIGIHITHPPPQDTLQRE